MSVTEISSLSQLNSILSGAPASKVHVIDFNATWCGPCHAIAPRYTALAQTYKQAVFLKCDVDKVQDVAAKYGVRAMPTFKFIKGGNVVDTVQGANPQGLENTLRKHAGPPGSLSGDGHNWGRGQTLGGEDKSSTPVPAPGVAGADAGAGGGPTDFTRQVQIGMALLLGYAVLWWFM